ncbi:M14 family zinc carboxypeptidase [Parapedobacter koreensis]|uniref:Zinc carboxypeptidase n=1 Tax=Parapedobacter koreensis TaxID=332977 RepID=A0A1H7GQ00_9SPHI|nr:M14 family zinc carboxypeptidase [Parapedobacter koreensis]SEK40129.1 Zinc carboxypeptidase [Parapedobacter koreensis]
MKHLKTILLQLLIISFAATDVVAQNTYYFPKAQFDPSIPSPETFLGYPIGSHYTRHDRIIAYFQELDRLSDKISVNIIGQSYEGRPLAVATITSAANHGRLEEIRQEHIRQVDPQAPQLDASTSPVVVLLDYSVHGAETSSGEASLLTAYYLVASQDQEAQKWLDEAVILIDIAQNPDGRDRTANWHNAYKSTPPVADPLDKEHLEQFPGGRTNHYFTDLNRDWLSITQIETQPKIDFFHQWYPNVHIDFHEMGGGSTYYFEPTPKSSESPLIPKSSYDFNTVLAKYHVEALDGIGSLYFTKEVFDNFSPIYGSTYPDFHGAVGATFEQGSSRGLLQETANGLLEFRFTVRNQLLTGLATVKGAIAEKAGLFNLQKDFFRTALDEARAHKTKSYIFGDEHDESLTQKLVDLLLRHRITVFELGSDQTIDGKSFKQGSAYVVPAVQPQFRLVHSIFEETPPIQDSVFYGSTSYSIIHAYGLKYAKSASAVSPGNRVSNVKTIPGAVVGDKSNYAYLLGWTEYTAPRALYALLEKGVFVKAAFKPFTSSTAEGPISFGYGSLVIPVAGQTFNGDSLYRAITAVASEAGLKFYSVSTGFNVEGIDLGSNNIQTLQKPHVALVLGQGINSAQAGQVWYLLNEHLKLPVVKIDPTNIPRANLSKYTTLILTGGSYNGLWDKETTERIKSWVNNGGTLIAFQTAAEWAIANGIVREKVYRDTTRGRDPQTGRLDYATRSEATAPDRLSGNIFSADIDITHPVAFGLQKRKLFVNIDGSTILLPSADRFSTVAQFDSEPWVNGYISKQILDPFRDKAYILASSAGQGSVVLFSDDPTYRKYWYGTDRLLINSIFFGNHISSGGRR